MLCGNVPPKDVNNYVMLCIYSSSPHVIAKVEHQSCWPIQNKKKYIHLLYIHAESGRSVRTLKTIHGLNTRFTCMLYNQLQLVHLYCFWCRHNVYAGVFCFYIQSFIETKIFVLQLTTTIICTKLILAYILTEYYNCR